MGAQPLVTGVGSGQACLGDKGLWREARLAVFHLQEVASQGWGVGKGWRLLGADGQGGRWEASPARPGNHRAPLLKKE